MVEGPLMRDVSGYVESTGEEVMRLSYIGHDGIF